MPPPPHPTSHSWQASARSTAKAAPSERRQSLLPIRIAAIADVTTPHLPPPLARDRGANEVRGRRGTGTSKALDHAVRVDHDRPGARPLSSGFRVRPAQLV